MHGELTALPRLPNCILKGLLLGEGAPGEDRSKKERGEGKATGGEDGKGKKNGSRVPPLLQF